MESLDKIGGSDAMKRGVEGALKSSKEFVNTQITKAMAKSNLPAHGEYSRLGEPTKNSIDRDMTVQWNGLEAEIKVGFDFKKSGLTSIFLMYGTPRMSPANGLEDAIYGRKTQKQIAKLQEEALFKVESKLWG